MLLELNTVYKTITNMFTPLSRTILRLFFVLTDNREVVITLVGSKTTNEANLTV